jgi:hypothetical protein
MAVYQILFILVNIAFLTSGEITNTNWTTVYQFWPLEDKYIVLEPKFPIANLTEYSICLRVWFWMKGQMYVFDSPALQLYLNHLYESDDMCLTIKETDDRIWFTGQLSSEWNALCFTHNLTDFVFNITLNGEQIGSKKVSITSEHLEKLAEPFSIGLEKPFWGQITDFNIWNVTLSNKELNQYSFGCQEGLLTQPEILDWANTNITNKSFGSEHFQMQRQLLTCQYKIKQSHDFFKNAFAMSYNSSIEFCQLLRGDLIDPFKEDLSQFDFKYKTLWVPIAHSRDVNKTINTTFTTIQKEDQCMSVDMALKEYMPMKCSEGLDFVCKVLAYGKFAKHFV